MNIFRHFASNHLQGPVPSDSAATSGGGGSSGGSRSSQIKGDQNTDNQSTGNGKQPSERALSASEDADWVQKAQTGDTRAFDRLVTKHRGKIYAMILNMVKNDADAWDLSQEAFIKAWKALPKFEARAQFSTWLFRISHNVVYDWLRKRRIVSEGELNDEVFDASRIDSSAATAPQHNLRPDEQMEQSELREQIRDAISKLSEEHREVILLREVQGMDYKEIAEITKNSMGTVMSRIHYARKKLQTYLEPQS